MEVPEYHDYEDKVAVEAAQLVAEVELYLTALEQQRGTSRVEAYAHAYEELMYGYARSIVHDEVELMIGSDAQANALLGQAEADLEVWSVYYK